MLKTILRSPLLNKCVIVTPTSLRSLHIKEQKIKVKDVDINYVQIGEGQKSVLLLPGALGSAWTDFKPQIEKLPDLLPNHTIIAWDPPGYGKSRPPKRKFDLNFFQNDAEYAVNLMKALQRPKFSTLGWSNGGITAIIIGGRFPEVVDKIVIWGAGVYLTAKEAKIIKASRDVSKLSPQVRESMEKVYGLREFAELWAAWNDGFIAFYTDRNGDYARREADNIKAPTFILYGKQDPVIAAEHAPYLMERIPGAKYHEFPEGKHNIHLRYADEFNKLVTDFLLDK